MRVRAKVDHMNIYGDSIEKKAKDEYDIPNDDDAKVLINAGIVEKAKDEK